MMFEPLPTNRTTVSGAAGSGVLANANGGALTINTGSAAINGTTGGITANQFGVGSFAKG